MKDMRSGKPSASIFGRLRACPGSWALSQGQPDVETPWGKQGDGIHAWLCAKLSRSATSTPVPNLSHEDEETAEMCLKLVTKACAAAGYGSLASATSVLVEERLWFDDVWSGQFDLAIQWGTRWLLTDFKTGRGDVDEPADNQQLRALVALLSVNYFPSEVTVAIIQPWVSPQIPPLAKYGTKDLEQAEYECSDIIAAALRPGATRTAGDHCKYCPAGNAGVCPELNAQSKAVAVMPAVDLMPSADMAKWLEVFDQAELAIEAGRKRAKAMLAEDPNSIPGWRLAPGVEREKVVDVKTLWQRVSATGVSSERFIQGVSVTKKEVKDMLREATGQKGGALEATIDAALTDCVESKTTAPSLKRI